MYQGSCLCGAVNYEVSGELGPIIYCHCKRCRKASGGAFGAVSPIPAASFTIRKGSEALKSFVAESGLERVFCGECGSPIIGRRAAMPDIVRLRLGTLDSALNDKVSSHIYTGSKAEWHDICDAAPQHLERS